MWISTTSCQKPLCMRNDSTLTTAGNHCWHPWLQHLSLLPPLVMFPSPWGLSERVPWQQCWSPSASENSKQKLVQLWTDQHPQLVLRKDLICAKFGSTSISCALWAISFQRSGRLAWSRLSDFLFLILLTSRPLASSYLFLVSYLKYSDKSTRVITFEISLQFVTLSSFIQTRLHLS